MILIVLICGENTLHSPSPIALGRHLKLKEGNLDIIL